MTTLMLAVKDEDTFAQPHPLNKQILIIGKERTLRIVNCCMQFSQKHFILVHRLTE